MPRTVMQIPAAVSQHSRWIDAALLVDAMASDDARMGGELSR